MPGSFSFKVYTKKEVALNVLSVLEGPSWTQCADLDLSELGKPEILFRRVDSQWAYDAWVEMPQAFENFFFKLRRKERQSLLESTAEFHQFFL